MDNLYELIKHLLPDLFPMVLILGIVPFIKELLEVYIKKYSTKAKTQKSYSEKLSELTRNLSKSSREVDEIISELANVAAERERALIKLESDLQLLENRETEAKKRIKDLENVPLAAVEHFAKLTSAGEKKSARRDYFLFAAGVVVSTIVAIILKLLGWA